MEALVDDNTRLDRPARVLGSISKRFGAGRLGSLLRGEWLGHPLHPMLTDIPIGCWTSAAILDVVGGRRSRRASQLLVGLGVLSVLPTAAAGAADYDGIDDQPARRLGAAHAASIVAATVLYAMSWQARRRGGHGMGVALGMAGGTVASLGGYLGGHLAFGGGTTQDETPDE